MKINLKKFTGPFLVFFIFGGLFLSVHLWSGKFISSDDPYYHAKHAYLIEQSGNLSLIEPWLEFHFLNYAPTDPWWGYHLGLALFISWFGLFLGVKIYSSFLAALIFLVFYLILNQLKIKWPWLWLGLLFFSSSVFSYRLFLERPHLLSIIALPLALWCLIKEKYFWLFILSLVYALSYHLAPLIILQTVIYSAVDAYYHRRLNLRPLIASAGGILAGIIIHPASLNYVYVMFVHLWQVLFIKFSGIDLRIGGELQLTGFFESVSYNFLAILAYLLGVVLFFGDKSIRQNSIVRNFLFIYASLWFLVVLMVPRAVEYWLPVALIFSGIILTDFIATDEFRKIKDFLTKKINIRVLNFFIICAALLIIGNTLTNIFSNIYHEKINSKNDSYYQANRWLMANSPKGAVIFYNNWGMWPMMFFYNDYNHYITGMDPTFLYEYDKATYWLWRNISQAGLACDQPEYCHKLSLRDQIKFMPLAIKNVFRAEYVMVENNPNGSLIKTLNNLYSEVRLVFKNQDLLIYKIIIK